jgi:hypothetical protein
MVKVSIIEGFAVSVTTYNEAVNVLAEISCSGCNTAKMERMSDTTKARLFVPVRNIDQILESSERIYNKLCDEASKSPKLTNDAHARIRHTSIALDALTKIRDQLR